MTSTQPASQNSPQSKALFAPRGVNQVATLVAQHHGIPYNLMFSTSRCRLHVARSRQMAMYLSHVILGQSLTTVGHAFGRDRTTVSYACAVIEDMRDDPVFDAEVSALEVELEQTSGRV